MESVSPLVGWSVIQWLPNFKMTLCNIFPMISLQSSKTEGLAVFYFSVPELETALQLADNLFESKYGTFKPDEDGRRLVIHCRSGVRSFTALKIARKLGYDK